MRRRVSKIALYLVVNVVLMSPLGGSTSEKDKHIGIFLSVRGVFTVYRGTIISEIRVAVDESTDA